MQTAIDRGWSEREVTVNRLELLKTLQENRVKHTKEYDEAVVGYKEQATSRLASLKSKIESSIKENFTAIQKKIDSFDPTADDPLQDTIVLTSVTSFSLQVPRSHEKSYDVAIQMAKWEVADTITLTQSQFQCFVLDDWDWKVGFETLNKRYTNKM